ncbi:uncharacterized protein CDAR_567331 [Caerostris darwini]|uniref:Ribosomal protein S14 n=1 Tax=Caerostris darwini TaxID=1538125 RepID=A0AAV4QZV5_9ARAC|nr:uncharacterized protein CDAR_567331 [Caerostris darwini]
MSGDIEGRYATSSNKLSNTWTVARSASRRLSIEWTFVDGVPRLGFERRIMHSIRDRLRTNRSLMLRNKISQAKALKLASLSPASSHFAADGAFMRFADWRFIHKARLNLMPLNGCQPWKR